MRITPAHAGNIPYFFRRFCLPQNHPRACGEYDDAVRSAQPVFESPPRMRGISHTRRMCACGLGITPAHAGNIVVIKPFTAPSECNFCNLRHVWTGTECCKNDYHILVSHLPYVFSMCANLRNLIFANFLRVAHHIVSVWRHFLQSGSPRHPREQP